MMRTKAAVVVATVALAVPSLAPAAQRAVEERRPAAPDAVVEVSNLAGSVQVTGWQRDEVEVTGTLGEGVERLDVTGDEGHIRIEVVLPERAWRGRFGKDLGDAHLTIRMPRLGELEVETVSADIAVSGLTGRAELESVSGAIRVEGAPEEVEAQSVSGSVDVALSEITRRTSARSVSGSVAIRGARGTVEASTVSGTVEVAGDGAVQVAGRGPQRANLESVSGTLRYEAGFAPGGSYQLKSFSGSVRVAIPEAAAARVQVTTFSGEIDSDFGQEPRRTSRHAPGKELTFTLGGGGAQVKIESFSGRIEIRRRG